MCCVVMNLNIEMPKNGYNSIQMEVMPEKKSYLINLNFKYKIIIVI